MLFRQKRVRSPGYRISPAVHFVGVAVFAAALFFPTLGLFADAPTATAVLTSSETEIGRPVQLQIKITGASNATRPGDIAVDGLDIRYTGQSQLVEGRNFQFSYSFIYNYTVMPLRPGTFKIPPQVLRTGHDGLRTPELTLNVADSPVRSSRSNQSTEPADDRKLAFAELVVTKASAYVGEVIPVEIRLGFSVRTRSRLTGGPELTGQGFTTQKMPQPQQNVETINGRSYEVLTFKTAIAAARAGKFEIGPVEAKALVQVPRRSAAPRSPFDLFNMDDPFADPFFNNPFAGSPEQREVDIKSEPASLEVKALPPNQPPNFSGAIGAFTMATDVKPKSGQIGDPLTVSATISGRGNFDRVSTPVLENERGWHKYPPSSNFKQDDDIGISGSKSFEMVLTPNERKSEVPPLIFSYFDPLKAKYVTLKSGPIAVQIEGGAAPSATPAAIAASATPPAVTAHPSAAPQAQDILYQLTESPAWVDSFTPLYARPMFWMIQAIPLLGLLGFIGWKLRQARMDNREGQRRAALQQEAVELQRKLRRGEGSPDEYFAEAARIVQIKTALARKVEPHTVDADVAVATFGLTGERREHLRELFRRSDELRYSGGANGNGTVPEETRREVIDLLDNLS